MNKEWCVAVRMDCSGQGQETECAVVAPPPPLGLAELLLDETLSR